MRKQWVAILSMLGLAGPAAQAQSRMTKGSNPSVTTPPNPGRGAPKAPPAGGKLTVNQQTLRTQNPAGPGGKQADPLTPSAYCAGGKQGGANHQLTPPPPGSARNNAITKGNNAITKGNNAVTKGNNAITKGGPEVKAKPNNLDVNQQKLRTQNQGAGKQADPLTPSAYCAGGRQGVNRNNAVTKGSQEAITKGGPEAQGRAVKRQALTKGVTK